MNRFKFDLEFAAGLCALIGALFVAVFKYLGDKIRSKTGGYLTSHYSNLMAGQSRTVYGTDIISTNRKKFKDQARA